MTWLGWLLWAAATVLTVAGALLFIDQKVASGMGLLLLAVLSAAFAVGLTARPRR